MPHAMLKVSLLGYGICFLGGCGASQTTAPRAPDIGASVMPPRRGNGSQPDGATPAERLVSVRQIASAGPDIEGGPEKLVEALILDEDMAVRKVAAVGLLSFGDKALGPLRKRLPPRDAAPSSVPNPQPAPDELLGVIDLIVYFDPYFAGGLEAACKELMGDANPALRVVGVRALAATLTELDWAAIRAAAATPDEKIGDSTSEKAREAARNALKQRASVLDTLRTAAKDGDAKVREAARDALKRLGG